MIIVNRFLTYLLIILASVWLSVTSFADDDITDLISKNTAIEQAQPNPQVIENTDGIDKIIKNRVDSVASQPQVVQRVEKQKTETATQTTQPSTKANDVDTIETIIQQKSSSSAIPSKPTTTASNSSTKKPTQPPLVSVPKYTVEATGIDSAPAQVTPLDKPSPIIVQSLSSTDTNSEQSESDEYDKAIEAINNVSDTLYKEDADSTVDPHLSELEQLERLTTIAPSPTSPMSQHLPKSEPTQVAPQQSIDKVSTSDEAGAELQRHPIFMLAMLLIMATTVLALFFLVSAAAEKTSINQYYSLIKLTLIITGVTLLNLVINIFIVHRVVLFVWLVVVLTTSIMLLFHGIVVDKRLKSYEVALVRTTTAILLILAGAMLMSLVLGYHSLFQMIQRL